MRLTKCRRSRREFGLRLCLASTLAHAACSSVVLCSDCRTLSAPLRMTRRRSCTSSVLDAVFALSPRFSVASSTKRAASLILRSVPFKRADASVCSFSLYEVFIVNAVQAFFSYNILLRKKSLKIPGIFMPTLVRKENFLEMPVCPAVSR